MEKQRLKAEAQPVQVYIPPPKPQAKKTAAKSKKIETFTAVAPAKPGDKPDKKKTKPKKNNA
jgi:hypothetical protein